MRDTHHVEIVLVRHGRTFENESGTLQGQDPRRGRLTPLGMEQARAVGRALATEPFGRVYCSPLERAVLTMSLMLCERADPGTRPIGFDDDLREIHMGALHGASRADWLAAARRHGDPVTFTPAGGESWAGLQARVAAWFERTISAEAAGFDAPALVVAHGGVVRGILTALAGQPMAMGWAGIGDGPTLTNGGISRVRLDANGHVVELLANDTRHLVGLDVEAGAGQWWDPAARRWRVVG